ncbi:hypothetical protein E2562_038102 [Oryza meyeriana var. granulata]|uniref:Uncharacterized protein n=1 Tax=Oryza meyeriana var. granulata TaxID=110450 RepID=A0A6G1EU87_9ORYZ|nr:hypothetical protein E2562_038102 [Oryza meyeriana var. granulata]
MSDKCGNCDCADKSQCVKKGTSYGVVIVDAEKRYVLPVAALPHRLLPLNSTNNMTALISPN